MATSRGIDWCFNYACAVAQVIAERVYFWTTPKGSFINPLFFKGKRTVRMSQSIAEIVQQKDPESGALTVLVVFFDGSWVKLQLSKNGPITAENPPIVEWVQVHGWETPTRGSKTYQHTGRDPNSTHTQTFGKYGGKGSMETPELRDLLRPFMPDFAPFHENDCPSTMRQRIAA